MAWHHEFMDERDNASTALPKGERIEWSGFWLTELYAPSHATALIDGMDDLNSRTTGLFRTDDLSAWIRSARRWTGGFMNVGFFAQPGTYLLASEPAGLPKEFEFASITAHQVAPGISVLICQFSIAENERGCLDKALRSEVTSKAIARSRGHSVLGPELQKKDRVREERERLRGLATEWLSAYFPGFFMSDDDRLPPCWDFITTESNSLVGDADGTRWRDVLGFGWPRTSKSEDLPGVELLLSRDDHRSGATETFAIKRADAQKILDGEDRAASDVGRFFRFMDDHVKDLLSLWTLSYAIRACEGRFSLLRDELSSPPSWLSQRKRMKQMRHDVMPLAFDLETIRDASQNEEALAMPLRHSGTEFGRARHSRDQRPEGPEDSLLNDLRDGIRSQGKAVASQAQSTTNALRVQADLLMASANVRIQWTAVVLTAIAGIVGVYATISGG